MLPTIEKRDLVIARECRRHQMTTNKSRPAENQELHLYTRTTYSTALPRLELSGGRAS